MKTKNIILKMLSIMLIFVIVASVAPLKAFATEGEDPSVGHALVLTSDHLSVAKRKTIQMTASVTNVETQPKITWTSSDESVATVDETGKVKGIEVGRAVIFATAEVDGETLRGEFSINVVKRNSILKNFLESRQVLSYQYSYVDDYYYTNDKQAWQHNFGFGKIYDFFSPYILLEYDYIRIFFTYDERDWMLQLWKGQYGMVFYGGEIGIYNKKHSDEGVGFWTMFACPEEEDWLQMEMTLWHQKIDGRWNREFTRDYDYYWWCTGFKNGHLRQEEPADELRLTGRITFKDEEMAKLVADGFAECGFSISDSKENMGLDAIYVDGTDIHFCWQNISEAESTMAIKVGTGILATLPLIPILPLLLPFVGAFSLIISLVNFIL